jgi:hypothetical protein
MISTKGVAGALGPFVPVLIGIVLKFSLFDKLTTDLPTHFKTTYLTGIWIDFIVTAYISSIAWFLTRKKIDTKSVIVLLVVPLVCFVACVLLTLGMAKAGAGEFWTLYLPALIAALSVAMAGNALAVAE